jgi:hypothetical protein
MIEPTEELIAMVRGTSTSGSPSLQAMTQMKGAEQQAVRLPWVAVVPKEGGYMAAVSGQEGKALSKSKSFHRTCPCSGELEWRRDSVC